MDTRAWRATAQRVNAKAHIDPNVMVFVRFVVTGIILFAFGLPNYLSKGEKLTIHATCSSVGFMTSLALSGTQLSK